MESQKRNMQQTQNNCNRLICNFEIQENMELGGLREPPLYIADLFDMIIVKL